MLLLLLLFTKPFFVVSCHTNRNFAGSSVNRGIFFVFVSVHNKKEEKKKKEKKEKRREKREREKRRKSLEFKSH